MEKFMRLFFKDKIHNRRYVPLYFVPGIHVYILYILNNISCDYYIFN